MIETGERGVSDMYFTNPVVKMTMGTHTGKHAPLGLCTISIDMGGRQPDIELYAAKAMPGERCSFSSSSLKKAIAKAVAAYKKADGIF